MSWEGFLALIGAVTGVISILAVVYAFAWKFGNIETRLANIESNQIDQIEFGKLIERVDTLFKIYVIDTLRYGEEGPESNNPGSKYEDNPGPSGGNPEKEKTGKLPSDIREEIRRAIFEHVEEDLIDIVSRVVQKIIETNPESFVEYLKTIEVPPGEEPSAVFIEEVAEEVRRLKRASEESTTS